MNYQILRIFVYYIIIQALFLGLHFFTIKKPNRISNRILGCLLLSFAMAILSLRIIFDIPEMNFFLKKYLYIVHLMLNLSMYILLLHYIQSIYKETLNFSIKHHLIHIISFISYLVFCQILIKKIPTLLPDDIKLYTTISSVKVSLYFIYLMLVFSYLRKEYNSFSVFFSIQKNPNFLWLMVLIGSFIFLWLMEFFILLSAMLGIINAMFNFILIGSIIAPFIFINTILIMALKKPLIFYVNPSWSMKENDQNKYMNGFIELMEKENVYKDPELTLNKISELLNINPKYLSLILNKQMHSSFPDIVNKYRIKTCKQLLEDGSDMTIQQIMYNVGYNSKSTFSKHFKRITGCTPSEYKVKYSNKINI